MRQDLPRVRCTQLECAGTQRLTGYFATGILATLETPNRSVKPLLLALNLQLCYRHWAKLLFTHITHIFRESGRRSRLEKGGWVGDIATPSRKIGGGGMVITSVFVRSQPPKHWYILKRKEKTEAGRKRIPPSPNSQTPQHPPAQFTRIGNGQCTEQTSALSAPAQSRRARKRGRL